MSAKLRCPDCGRVLRQRKDWNETTHGATHDCMACDCMWLIVDCGPREV